MFFSESNWDMTYERLMNEPEHLLLKCISGSKAYNLDGPQSDTDLRGIFVQPKTELFGLNVIANT